MESLSTAHHEKRSLPLVSSDFDLDQSLRDFEAAERQRLGLEPSSQWVETMANLSFSKAERSKITMLLGGLTVAHDYLVSGGLKNCGYEVQSLDAPDYDALRIGKEFGNRGQCNPTYFTVGNLVKVLLHLRDHKGMSTEEIISKYVFLTAGACGPCRFGMYTTEYRKALRDAGFDGFRVIVFQQQGGLSQASGDDDSGLEMNPRFFINMLKGLVAGDIINGLGYRIRPYEVVPGETDRVIEQAKRLCYDALLHGRSILMALHRSKRLFSKIEIDRSSPKPRVAIIGEFWAMTTEGDGNYRLQRFLEKEGAETDIQFLTAWLLYNIWEVEFDTAQRKLLRQADQAKLGLSGIEEFGPFTRRISLKAADIALRTAFHTFALAGGYYDYHLPNMKEVADVAAPYYDNDLRGGEGHMEVGKLILNVVKNKATMTLSVKPFGCMPSSSVSDGVQSLITDRYPGTIFCAVETSGDGAVNFQSRVQMYLYKAKKAAETEFEAALARAGMSQDEFRLFLRKNPRFAGALHRAPHSGASTPVELVNEVAEYRNSTGLGRLFKRGKALGKSLAELPYSELPGKVQKAATQGKQLAAELAELARDYGPDALIQAKKQGLKLATKVLARGPWIQETQEKSATSRSGASTTVSPGRAVA